MGEPLDGVWLSHDDPASSVMLQSEDAAFVRALLPLHTEDGGSVTFGVWVQVTREELHRVLGVWFAPEYPELVVEGALANEVGDFGLLGGPVRLAVVDADHTPYCVGSGDDAVVEVLRSAWPRERVVAGRRDGTDGRRER